MSSLQYCLSNCQKWGWKMRIKNKGQKWGSKIRVKNERVGAPFLAGQCNGSSPLLWILDPPRDDACPKLTTPQPQNLCSSTSPETHRLLIMKGDISDSPYTCEGKASKPVLQRTCTHTSLAELQRFSIIFSSSWPRPALSWSGSCWTPAGCQSNPHAASPSPSRAFGFPQMIRYFHFLFP